MGRRKKCEQIKRTNNVMVRFTDAEYASISISAEQAGYPVAVYVRKSALDERIEVHYNITAELPELQKLIAEYIECLHHQVDKRIFDCLRRFHNEPQNNLFSTKVLEHRYSLSFP